MNKKQLIVAWAMGILVYSLQLGMQLVQLDVPQGATFNHRKSFVIMN